MVYMINQIYNVMDYGAAADGSCKDTIALQKAIDACSYGGGGTVLLTAGIYKSATIELKDNVTLHLESGARIVGSSNLADYRDDIKMFVDAVGHTRGRCLIYAHGAVNIGITGAGVIDGSGAAFKHEDPLHKHRPFLLRMLNCTDVRVCDVQLVNSPAWVSHYLCCKNVTVRGITIKSRVNENNDGIDIDSCSYVRISDCHINTGDDAICLKTTDSRACHDITVTNCVLSSGCGAIKLGTESVGDMRNISVSNCTLYDVGICGIKIISMDGAELENIAISNITMDRVTGPIFIRLGDRGNTYHSDTQRPAGFIRNVSLSNIIANVETESLASSGIFITGVPAARIDGVSLSDISVTFPGGGLESDMGNQIPEMVSDYPEHNYFGTLPAYGVYIRHADDIYLTNIRLRLASIDKRVAIGCDDVNGLTLTQVFGDIERSGKQELLLENTTGVKILGGNILN
jgi:polygalacturonase